MGKAYVVSRMNQTIMEGLTKLASIEDVLYALEFIEAVLTHTV